MEAPHGFELLPGDLANPLTLNSEGGSKGDVEEKTDEGEGKGESKEESTEQSKEESKEERESLGEGSIAEGKTEASEEKAGELDQHGRDKVFLCVQARCQQTRRRIHSSDH